MSIQQVTKLATNLLQNAKKLPVKHVCLAKGLGIFGAGLLVGKALWGDSFEKEQISTLQHESDSLKQANTLMSQELVALKEQLEPEADKFKYEPPIYEGVVADTTRYLRNNNISEILYSIDGKPFHATNYDLEGNFKGYSVIGKNGIDFSYYDENGKWVLDYEEQKDGTRVTTYDKARYTDKTGKYIIEDFEYFVAPENKVEERVYTDPYREHLVQEKHYKDGLLQYTVTPKYNKDGDLIQRDTTWVNK